MLVAFREEKSDVVSCGGSLPHSICSFLGASAVDQKDNQYLYRRLNPQPQEIIKIPSMSRYRVDESNSLLQLKMSICVLRSSTL